MPKLYIGIDNGTSGSVALLRDGSNPAYYEIPSFTEQSYTKAKQNISRIDRKKLKDMIISHLDTSVAVDDALVVIERPCVNPGRFKTSISAVRALEAVLGVVEDLALPHIYTDSRAWQKSLLPKGVEGSTELKKASLDIGLRLFPSLENAIKKHKDADGLLIAEWARRAGL